MTGAEKKILKAALKIMAQAQEMLGNIDVSELEELSNTLDERFDNLPESVQNGDRGERITEEKDAVEEFTASIEELNDLFTEKIEALQNIIG